MKAKRKNRILAAAISLTFTAPSAFAVDLTWDTTSGDGAAITAATGSWNTTAGNSVWNNAGTNVIWSQTLTTDGSNTATFAGADGTTDQYVITLAAQMAAESITFNNSGYKITGSTLAVMPTTTTNGAITVAAGKTATINSAIAYANNVPATLTANSGSTLNLGGGASNAQYTFNGTGTVNMTAGTYSANIGSMSAATFNQFGGTFNVTPGNAVGYNINSAVQNVAYNLSAGTLSVNGNSSTANSTYLSIGSGTGSYTSALNVSGNSTMNVGTTASRSGEIRIGNTAASNGTLNVSGGTVNVGTGNATNQIYFFKAGSSSGFTANMTQSAGTVTVNGIQFGGSTGNTTYSSASSANLTVTGGSLYIGAVGITKGSEVTALNNLPTTIKLEGGTIGASDTWSSSLDMKLGTTGGGPTFQAATSGGASKNITLSGILSNQGAVNGTLTKTGSGTLTLAGANTFSGGVTIKNGTLESKTTTTTLGNGTVTMGGSGSTGATYITGQSNSNPFVINAPDSGSVVIGTNGGGSGFILSGGITLNGNLTIQTFDNVISGSTKAGGIVTGGITGTGSVVLNNIGLAANTLSLTVSAINHTGSLTLQGTATGDTTIGANIGSNVTSVTQNSATSRLILNGTNSYSGVTTVGAGTDLRINGTNSGAGAVNIAATGKLGGSGRVIGGINVSGILAPGNSIESLGGGDLSFATGSTYAYELQTDLLGSAPGLAADLAYSSGTLNIASGTILTLTDLGASTALTNGSKLTLISSVGAWNSGLFSYDSGAGLTTLADDSDITLGANIWRFNYNDSVAGSNFVSDTAGATNFVTLTVVPEPNIAALVGGLGMLTLLRRRRN